jgi:hypothetical protein
MRFFLVFILLISLNSCNRNINQSKVDIGYKQADSVKAVVSLKEKNLKSYYQQLMSGEINQDTLPETLMNDLIKEYKLFVQKYPNDSISPFYLDKIHQLYLQDKRYAYAVDWVDTLLLRYPDYKNKTMVLYSAATTTDMFLLDTIRVKGYYHRMLKECPKLKVDVKSEINRRLKNLKTPYIDYLNLR